MKTRFVLLIICLVSFTGIQAQPCIANTNSLDFNGTGSAVRINTMNGLDITNQITIEAWVNASAFASGPAGGSIFCKHAWGSSTFGYVLRAGGSGQLSFNIAGAVGGSPVGWKETMSPVNALTLNTWHHVAGVFDGTMLYCYVDGLPVGSTAFSGTIYPSTGIKPRIGALADTNWGMTRYWDGYIDAVRVWNRALSQSEIATGMNDHVYPSSSTGLVGYWRLNEGSGALAGDLGSGNNYGTILNATWTTQTGFNNPPPAVPVITYTAGQLHSSSVSGNQWYAGSTLIPNATSQNYTPTAYGIYTVHVTLNGCTSISSPFNYNTTEVSETNAAQLQISPNPVADELFVRLPDSKQGFSYSVYDVSGTLLLKGIFQKNTTSLSVSSLPSGIYMLKTGNGDQVFTKRFVKH